MILKLKTRKNIYSSKQLCNYILTDKGRIENPFESPILLQNIDYLDLKNINKSFLNNNKFLKKRKGSIAFYHDIISFSPKDTEHITNEMLQDFIKQYIKLRGISKAVILAKAHTHEEHKHIHFMFSSNEYRSSKRLRMSQEQMKKLLWDLETYQVNKYPQLIHSVVHTNKEFQKKRNIAKENQNRRKEQEYQLKLRIGDKKTNKELVSDLVKDLFKSVGNFNKFVQKIKNTTGLQIYTYRGQIRGILYNDKKYRFSTLGISKEQLLQLDKVKSRLQELKLLKEMHQNTRSKHSRSR